MNLRILNILLYATLLSVLVNCTLCSSFQNGDGFTENSRNKSENVNNVPQRLPLTFGPETLNKLKDDPNFIAAYGSIPAFATSKERDQWIDTLSKIMNEVNANFDQEMSKYFYPNGPVTGCGVTIDGVIEVGINKSTTVDKLFMDNIYQIFDSKASTIGIKEVPVIFVHEDNPIPVSDAKSPELSSSSINNDSNSTNGNISNENNSGGNKPSKTSSVPGFELLVSFICLYCSWKLRKK